MWPVQTKITAVITARNEADNIADIVRQLIELGCTVHVMDDGSTDNTGQAARDAGAVVFTHTVSEGIARSLLELWRNAHSTGAMYVVQIDAGRSHDPLECANLLKEAWATDADIVVGSRFTTGGCYHGGLWWRKLGSQAFAVLCGLAMPGARIHDWTSGYRVFRRKAILQLMGNNDYLTNGHVWQAEVLAHALDLGLKVVEAPIKYAAGRSSLRPQALVDMLNVLLDMFFHRSVKPWKGIAR
jgi:glycosyltransferase involved in cell wall biosynthesis